MPQNKETRNGIVDFMISHIMKIITIFLAIIIFLFTTRNNNNQYLACMGNCILG